MNLIYFSGKELGETDLILIFGDTCSTHVRLCGKHGVDTSHDFFIRLLTKDGWLNETVSIKQLKHNICLGGKMTLVKV